MCTKLLVLADTQLMLANVLSFPFTNKQECHSRLSRRKQIQRGEALAAGHTAGNRQSCEEEKNTPYKKI